MPLDLHLFSTPGDEDVTDIKWIVKAARPYLEKKAGASLAYMPLASLSGEKTVEDVQKAFRGLARVQTINTEMMELLEMESILRGAALAYIPGGNTFLLNHRLHVSQLFTYLRKKLEAGLPLVAYSAGTVLCGPNILTSNDINMVPTTHFDGLNLTPFNFVAHYLDDPWKDYRLLDYQTFHENPLILLEDGAYVRIRGKETSLVRGPAWLCRSGQEKQPLAAGAKLSPLEV